MDEKPRRLLISSLLIFLVIPQGLFAQIAVPDEISYNPNFLASDDQMLDVYSTSKEELGYLLNRGSLATLQTPDAFGINKSALDIIWNASQEFGINPRFLSVLLQREQSLIEDPHPSQKQLDWAMGYAVCDDCEKSDPRIQKFKGFGNQVYFAAKRIRESYLSDLSSRGFTESGIGPGRVTTIDGDLIVPANMATAVLYTYTPHLHGNLNFVKIWNRWFDVMHVDGTLLQDQTTGGIWWIQNGLRRPITSRAAFLSRFNPNNVIQVGPSILEQYPIGHPIRFPNYSLLRSPQGTVFLLVDDARRGFTSQEALRGLGFMSDDIMDVSWDDLNLYTEGEPITTETVYPQGALLQNKKTGGIYFVRNGVKQPIMSREILTSNFPDPFIFSVNPEDLDAYKTGEPLAFPDGTLVGIQDQAEIFVISHGTRRSIANEETFISLGWKWNQVIWTNERSILIQPLGEELRFVSPEEELVPIEFTSL